MFLKIGVLINFAIFTRKQLCWSPFNKVASLRRFPVNIAKLFGKAFFTSGGCFWRKPWISYLTFKNLFVKDIVAIMQNIAIQKIQVICYINAMCFFLCLSYRHFLSFFICFLITLFLIFFSFVYLFLCLFLFLNFKFKTIFKENNKTDKKILYPKHR